MKNVIIVHGSNMKDLERIKEQGLLPQNERHWIPWLKKKLESKGIKIYTPLMPRNWDPDYHDYKDYFEQFKVGEDTILIGHSSGGGFLVRWLGETKQRIKKLVLVAPAIVTDKGDYGELKNLLQFKVSKDVRNLAKDIVIFVSEDESDGIKRSVELYKKILDAKIIELGGRKHFIEKHMGTKEFPELLKEVLK